jgi:hypothetical protein
MKSRPAFFVLAFVLGGCNGSSSSNSDAGSDVDLSYTNGSDAAEAGDSEAAAEAEAAPTCNIPPNANTFLPDEAGGTGCKPGIGVCTSPLVYRLTCYAANPSFVPNPDPSLGCNLTNSIDPTMLNYCCPCK